MSQRAGLYVHIPFCLTRCGYCDFNTYAGLDHLQGRYANALRVEAALAAPDWVDVRFVSLFLGGGTPTMLPAAAVGDLLSALMATFGFAPRIEITSEANPDTVDRGYLSALRAAGGTRLSLGVQSFDPLVLQSLERVHSAESARRAFQDARSAGFDNVNLDLIYGANGETLQSWRRTLDQAIRLGPEHLSCYALTVEPATPLGRRVASGLEPPPDPDLQAEMYHLACEGLAGAGYDHYEVSNWATPGRRCTHNLGYWEGRSYLGLGAGAHSYHDGRRWWNVRPPHQYLLEVEAGRLPIGGTERSNAEQRRLERLLLGLRHVRGIPTSGLNAERMEAFVADGLAERRGGRIVLTDRGLLVANDIVLELAI